MENEFFISYQDAPQRTAYQAEPVSAEALNAVLEAGTYAPTGSGRQFSTIIAITDPYYGAPVVDFDFGKWLRKYLCGGRKLPETLRGVGAIALGYPAQEAGQPAARKQNYIVRI